MSTFTLPNGYLSASSIKTFLTCPRQYEFRYIRKMVIPPNAALVTGSVFHKTLEAYYNDAMTSSVRLTPGQTAELSGDTLEEWVADNENTMSAEEKAEAHQILPDLVINYVDCIGQHIKPILTEKEFTYTTQDGVPLLGYIDLIYDKPSNDGTSNDAIADYKVTSKKLNKANLVNSLQFNLYALATGIGDIQIHNLTKTKPKPINKPSQEEGVIDYYSNLRTISHYFDGSQAAHFEDIVNTAAKIITAGVFVPCAPDSWCCTEDWCGYWKYCRGRKV